VKGLFAHGLKREISNKIAMKETVSWGAYFS